jgi:hypothetical protein
VGTFSICKTLPLEDLISIFAHQVVTDSREMAYALLGIARDSAHIEVDYSKSTLDVYAEALRHIILQGKLLDVIFRPWAPDSEVDLPSWVPNLNNISPPVNKKLWHRQSFDLLAGPSPRKRRFNASGADYIHAIHTGLKRGNIFKTWELSASKIGNF